MLVVPVVAAAGGAREDQRIPSARLQATGSGSITVDGRLAVSGTIPGTGRVVVIDRRGDARAYLAGQPLEFRRRRAIVRAASGILYVTGSRVSVQVVGVDLTFSIAGYGAARLRGVGVYRLNAEPEREWRRAAVRLAPSSSRRSDRRRARAVVRR
jgi:hypothetical protein